jgi:hypothetical protein
MAVSFGHPHFGIFGLPKPGKKLPKTAAFLNKEITACKSGDFKT